MSFRISSNSQVSKRPSVLYLLSSPKNSSKFWVSDWAEVLLKHIAVNNVGPTHTSRWLFLFSNIVYNSYQFISRNKSPVDSQYWQSKQKGMLNQNIETWIEMSCQYFVPILISNYMKLNLDNTSIDSLKNKHKPLLQINKASFNILKKLIDSYLLNRDNDGWKQAKDLNGSLPNEQNVIYADNTVSQNLNNLPHKNKWTPLSINGHTKNYLTPEWGTVNSGVLNEDDTKQLLDDTNELFPSDYAYEKEMEEVISITSNLKDNEKVIAEFWAGGPGTVTPPGMWIVFLDLFMRSNQFGLYEEIKNYVIVSTGIYQAGIYAWKLKREHMQARPIQKIRQHILGNNISQDWNSQTSGEFWLPYQELDFVSPPFPDFVSGHSTFSATASKLFCYLFGTDLIILENPVVNSDIINYLSPILEDVDNFTLNNIFVRPNSSKVKNTDPLSAIRLNWNSWSEMANSSGRSRIFGGIHCESSNQAGLFLGNKIGDKIWNLLKNI